MQRKAGEVLVRRISHAIAGIRRYAASVNYAYVMLHPGHADQVRKQKELQMYIRSLPRISLVCSPERGDVHVTHMWVTIQFTILCTGPHLCTEEGAASNSPVTTQ